MTEHNDTTTAEGFRNVVNAALDSRSIEYSVKGGPWAALNSHSAKNPQLWNLTKYIYRIKPPREWQVGDIVRDEDGELSWLSDPGKGASLILDEDGFLVSWQLTDHSFTFITHEPDITKALPILRGEVELGHGIAG